MNNTNKSEGLLIYESMRKNEQALSSMDKMAALEYIEALLDYSFDGKEYTGDNLMVKMLLNTDTVLIDNQRVRYGKAVKGGEKVKVSDDLIEEVLLSQHFTSYATAARAIAIESPDGKFSYQALQKRLKTMGFENLEDFYSSHDPKITTITTTIHNGCEKISQPSTTVVQPQPQLQPQPQHNIKNPTNTYTSTSTFTDTWTFNDCDDVTTANQNPEEKVKEGLKQKKTKAELTGVLQESYPDKADWQIETMLEDIINEYRKEVM